jgi:REP element-mobilizing transposase RayT
MEFDVNHRVDYVVRMIKGISSRRFFEEFNTNRYVSRKLWRRSYFAEIVKPQHLDIVSRYIEQQMRMGIDKRDI